MRKRPSSHFGQRRGGGGGAGVADCNGHGTAHGPRHGAAAGAGDSAAQAVLCVGRETARGGGGGGAIVARATAFIRRAQGTAKVAEPRTEGVQEARGESPLCLRHGDPPLNLRGCSLPEPSQRRSPTQSIHKLSVFWRSPTWQPPSGLPGDSTGAEG